MTQADKTSSAVTNTNANATTNTKTNAKANAKKQPKTQWKRLYDAAGARVASVIEFENGTIAISQGDPGSAAAAPKAGRAESREAASRPPVRYECAVAPDGTLQLKSGDRVIRGTAVRQGEKIWVHTGGRAWMLRLERESGGRAGPAAATSDEVRAPMTGTVRSILVEQGQQVERGRPLLIVEAMKMEHVLKASRDGTVASIQCKPGDLVDLGHVLLRLAPEIPAETAADPDGTAGVHDTPGKKGGP